MNTDNIHSELELIKRMVAESRSSTARAGDIYLVWGVGVLAALLCQWWMTDQNYGHIWLAWVVVGGACTLYSFAAPFFRRRDQRVVNFATRVTRNLWSALTVAIWGTALLGSISGTVDSRSVLPVIALMIGIGMVVTGALFRSGLFVGAGWLWLAGGLAAFFAALPLQILLFAALDVLGYIVPGVYLMIHERRRPENA